MANAWLDGCVCALLTDYSDPSYITGGDWPDRDDDGYVNLFWRRLLLTSTYEAFVIRLGLYCSYSTTRDRTWRLLPVGAGITCCCCPPNCCTPWRNIGVSGRDDDVMVTWKACGEIVKWYGIPNPMPLLFSIIVWYYSAACIVIDPMNWLLTG